ncbi:hypothetical protein DM02DRAFT_538240 [Periconia macrospinosa]|uniref:Zn(2)-C6 fungal-type domain-containing protein n=1 Tax=Periconia macrospinosa TaxID=97972 RepID=A0A2V1DAG4_9PLEO|nr:hypothetical protein DM02DRAFT_538240 [Periconia macrospinosa]
MPRAKKPGAGEPKRRSRNGCWPCKSRKIKCGEEKPQCTNCTRQGDNCDYSIRLTWGGRTKRRVRESTSGTDTPTSTDSSHTMPISFEHSFSASLDTPPPKRKVARYTHTQSATSTPPPNSSLVDPELMRMSAAQSPSLLAYDGTLEFKFPVDTRHPVTAFDYPSPGGSGFESSAYSMGAYHLINADSPSMPPPSRGSSHLASSSQSNTTPLDLLHTQHQRSYSVESPATASAWSPQTGPPTPYFSHIAMPLTPNSSAGSEDPTSRSTSKQLGEQCPSTDPPRLSVQSLLGTGSESVPSTHPGHRYPMEKEGYTIYGYDLGLPDLDTPRNDDLRAIAGFSPPSGTINLNSETQYGNVQTDGKDMVFEGDGYYAKPVPVKISKSFEPLPPLLLENPMNILYFHHFINHTARILVPHDCERNPFRNILPEMAINNDNILSLLLAYSASHRACMLNHPEPVNRVALWVRDVFPRLRASLASATDPSLITNSTLAPAIMMASLEIISPNTFEVPISWQNHLTMARQMIIARGGPRSMDRSDHVAYFLSRWFAYLDVLGSLSGNKNDQPLGSFYWSSENASADEDFQIDCLTGFTNRCVGSLARISELAKRVEPFRIRADGTIFEGFRPSSSTIAQADSIRRELEEGLTSGIVFKGCNHRESSSTSSPSSSKPTTWDATEIYATNEMFHWAGLIHLYRRVYNYPSTHPSVQAAVREIVELLYKVRRGSTAEACLLFPMFAAGCDAQDVGQREKIAERLRCVEGFGMTQVRRARGLMQRVWETGKAWESLVEGEFFG